MHILNKTLLLALGMQSLRCVQIICGTYVNPPTPCRGRVDIIMLIVQQKIKYIVELACMEGVFSER